MNEDLKSGAGLEVSEASISVSEASMAVGQLFVHLVV
jgi:hypothetical protein